MDAVPRHLFLPDLIWPLDVSGVYHPVDRRDDPSGWRAWADADTPIVTQWDDGAHTGSTPDGDVLRLSALARGGRRRRRSGAARGQQIRGPCV